MADVAATPFINFGESQAKQGAEVAGANLDNQQAGLVNQQTQSAAMQNKIMAARLPFIMRAYEQAGAQADTSGVDGQYEPGGPLAARQRQAEEHGFDASTVSKNNAQGYFVPEWTDSEKQNTQSAAISGDPAVVSLYATQRQQRLDTMKQKAAQAASIQYAKYAAGAVADDHVSALKAVDPNYHSYLTGKYAQAHPDADLDEMAKGYMQYQAADLHKYTGRPIDYKNDIAVDKDTGLPVAGVPRLPMSADKQAELTVEAQKPSITYQTGKGNTSQMAPWQAAGFSNVHSYLNAVAQGLAPDPEQLNKLTAGRTLSAPELAKLRTEWKTKAVQGASQNGITPPVDTTKMPIDPKNPGALQPVPPRAKKQPQQTPPAANASGSAPPQGGAVSPQPGAVPQQGQPGAVPQQGQAQQKDNGLLPGVDVDSLPRTQSPQNGGGTTLTPQQTTDVSKTEEERYAQLKSSSDQVDATQRSGALIRRAQAELTSLQSSPREVGPGSNLMRALDAVRTFASGRPPNELVNFGMLDKILLQMGAQNIRQALSGQKITNQEFMTMLSHGNPNTKQPLDTIKQLVDYAGVGNDYDARLANTKVHALRRGADPWELPGALSRAVDRGDYIESRTGVTPHEPGTEVHGPQSGAPTEGAKSKSKAGKPIVFQDGHWQYDVSK